jgi:hypothetical protein
LDSVLPEVVEPEVVLVLVVVPEVLEEDVGVPEEVDDEELVALPLPPESAGAKLEGSVAPPPVEAGSEAPAPPVSCTIFGWCESAAIAADWAAECPSALVMISALASAEIAATPASWARLRRTERIESSISR